MTREKRFCGFCGITNPHLSHWEYDTKRFCCREHRQGYIDRQESNKQPQLGLNPPNPHAYDVT